MDSIFAPNVAPLATRKDDDARLGNERGRFGVRVIDPATSAIARDVLPAQLVFVDGHFALREPVRQRRCHGFANGCECGRCAPRKRRQALPAPPAPKQPWELRAA